jgi:hypothetical protein
MIEYINKRMIDWAIWVKRRDDGGNGFSGVASYCNMVSIHGSACAGQIVEDAAEMQIERIMSLLKVELPQRYEVAYWVYLAGNLTMDRVAQKLRCHRDTVYARLHALHLHIKEELDVMPLEVQKGAAAKYFSKYS